MRLRRVAVVGTTLIATLTLVVSVMAIVLTTALARNTTAVERAHSATRDVELVRELLLKLAEDSDVAYVTRRPEDERVRSEREASLMTQLARARVSLQGTEQFASFEEVARKTHDYLVARRQAELQGVPLADVVAAAAPARREVLAVAGATAERLSTDLERFSERTRTWGEVADNIATVTGIAALVAFFGIVAVMYRLLFGPLLELTDAIRAFAGGDRTARASLHGSAELSALAQTFNELADREVRQDTDRLTFLAGVAHDLRNPLATLRAVTHHFRPGNPPPTERKLSDTMALIARQITRLDRMVGDFLDASRIESGQLELKPEEVDLRSVVSDAVELYRSAAGETAPERIKLRQTDEEVPVDIDPVRLGQVLNNLVSNAIKYSPNGGEIVISVERHGHHAVVEVTDHGIGIAASDLGHIFEPFRRTGASRELVPGVGLGLSVSRRIVEAHHGRLEVRSRVGEGSTFSLHLPLCTTRDGAHAASLH